jgi:hypothetical protein
VNYNLENNVKVKIREVHHNVINQIIGKQLVLHGHVKMKRRDYQRRR